MKKIYLGGKVYLGGEKKWAETVVSDGNKIAFVGTEKEGKALYPNATVIELKGKFLFPGFIDAHAHVLLGAYFNSGIKIDSESSQEEIWGTVKEYISENPNNDVYFGQGYGEWQFDRLGPTKEMLDEICADRPMVLLSAGGHEGVCNSKALEKAGITKETADPIPGFHYFVRNENSEPTGRFIESGCIYMLNEKIDFYATEKVETWIKNVLSYFSEIGITSISDCGAMPDMTEIGFPLLKKLAETGELPQRVMGCEFVSTKEEAIGAVDRLKKLRDENYIKDTFEFKTLKIINDGTMESASASTLEPYSHDGSIVEPMLEGEELNNLCIEAAKESFDIYIHGIGDRAIRATVEAAKAVREAGYNKTRITNAHTQLVSKEDVPKFGKYNIIANTTGCWHYGGGDGEEVLGKRIDETFAMKRLMDNGAILTLGSDFPVDELGASPFVSMEVAITRQYPGEREAKKLKPYDQVLSIEEVIDGYTINAAYQLGMEDKIGSIEVGKYADFTVTNENPFDVDVYKIHEIQVALTVQNGEIKYNNM